MNTSIEMFIIGDWENENDVKRRLFRRNNGYKYSVGNILNYDNKCIVNGFLSAGDKNILSQFEMLCPDNLTGDKFNDFLNHKTILNLSIRVRDLSEFLTVMEIGEFLFEIGGMCIFIPDCGMAYLEGRWFDSKNRIDINDENLIFYVYNAFVRTYLDGNNLMTVGMYIFNYPDFSIDVLGKEIKDMNLILNNFSLSFLVDNISLDDVDSITFIDENQEYNFSHEEDNRLFINGRVKNPNGVLNILV